jgi:hypothetical protein
MKCLIVARIHAEHPKAAEFNRDLELMRQRREALVAYLKSRAADIYSTMPKSYLFTAKDASQEAYLPASVKVLAPIRLIRKWVNKKDFEEVCRRYGVAVDGADQEEVVCSVVYYRMNGLILAMPGAGAHVLRANVPITDDEWDYLMRGVVLPNLKQAA